MTLASIDSLDENCFAVLFTAQDSELSQSQKPFIDSHSADLADQSLIFDILDATHENMIRPYFEHNSSLLKRSNLGDLLLFFKKIDGRPKLISIREKPESKYDWVAVFLQFVANHSNLEPDADNSWRFGQIVIEAGEYMCRDCGYIEEFKVGQIFPVCEVCLSGDPEGPVDTSAGYWEKL
jgi:hypothetical protein